MNQLIKSAVMEKVSFTCFIDLFKTSNVMPFCRYVNTTFNTKDQQFLNLASLKTNVLLYLFLKLNCMNLRTEANGIMPLCDGFM